MRAPGSRDEDRQLSSVHEHVEGITLTEEQIIAILKEHEAGMKTADLCRKHGISDACFYNWKAKYGGLEASEAKRLKGLENENAAHRNLQTACSGSASLPH